MANNIIGNQDGPNGRNETVRIPGRASAIPVSQINREIRAGMHPDFHVATVNGREYPRANPDSTTTDNINR